MAYFFSRLNAPRPTIAHDMTDAEAAVMGRHADYWNELLARGNAVVFGPVLDPKGAWGLGIVRAETEADARALIEDDPILGAGLGFSYEISPMPRTYVRGLTADLQTTARR
ncbi:YciI family protein [Lichenifustis flavocetrariae]|uniref:YciI family protein n=1 Tax=Lichenifustis flavocetrariae TaxID=2949735 RepID=A0AA42CJM0_9HYPH|nr:YciI family protein [Lichenifustis flavocetrariae]MCW6509619.1 YciI family protein [Lichenifustis flavocetrariae]